MATDTNSKSTYRRESEDCPFPHSTTIPGIRFTGRHHSYTKADTWYPSWSKDGRMFSTFTDGEVNGRVVWSLDRTAKSPENKPEVGHAIILGDSPDALEITEENGTEVTLSEVYAGRYPSANLYHEGIWYIGTYGLSNADYPGYNWPVLGPFCGFHISLDEGRTWTPSPWNLEVGATMFGEPAISRGPVKLGALHVVDFGRELEHAPDGKIHLIGHGTRIPDGVTRKANCSWITGDEVYLCRASPDPACVNNPEAYEFFAGHAADGTPCWSSNLSDIQPLLEWPGHMGCVTATYHPGLKKYLLAFTNGRTTVKEMDSYVLESDTLTGPYRLVWAKPGFGPQAYFLNFPSRFLSDDGTRGWLCLSANFQYFEERSKRYDPSVGIPEGCCYRMCLLEVEFDT